MFKFNTLRIWKRDVFIWDKNNAKIIMNVHLIHVKTNNVVIGKNSNSVH